MTPQRRHERRKIYQLGFAHAQKLSSLFVRHQVPLRVIAVVIDERHPDSQQDGQIVKIG